MVVTKIYIFSALLLGFLASGCQSVATNPPDTNTATNAQNPSPSPPQPLSQPPYQPPENISSELTKPKNNATVTQGDEQKTIDATEPEPAVGTRQTTIASDPFKNIEPLHIKHPVKTGNLLNSELNEVSGMSASLNIPGVLYAINDSGNSPHLFALNEQGQVLAKWDIAALSLIHI